MWPELRAQGKSPEAAFARDPMFQEESDKFESQPEVRKELIGSLIGFAT